MNYDIHFFEIQVMLVKHFFRTDETWRGTLFNVIHIPHYSWKLARFSVGFVIFIENTSLRFSKTRRLEKFSR